MEKTCLQCGKSKELIENFHKHSKSKDGFNSSCKECIRKRTLSNFYKNHEDWRKTHTKTRLEKKEKIQEIKKLKICEKCGENRHYLLDFHHVDPTQKSFQVSQGEGKGWNKVLEEIKKCILLCKNCHAEFHYLEKLNKISLKDYLS